MKGYFQHRMEIEAELPPAPTTLTRGTGDQWTRESREHWLRTAPLDQVKAYYEKMNGQDPFGQD